MEKYKKYLKPAAIGILALIIVGLLTAVIYTRIVKGRGVPDYNQDIVLEGLEGEVKVFRDTFGVPHIYATSEHDLYIAVGYCMAQDRIWQMDLFRRVTTGRLSEIFGEDLVEVDLLFRALRIEEKSRKILEESDEAVLANLADFSSGVNQYINRNRGNLPPEFSILGYEPEQWEPIHSINLIGYMAWDLTMPWDIELVFNRIRKKVSPELFNELVPDIKGTPSHIYASESGGSEAGLRYALLEKTKMLSDMGLGIFMASNNWAVSGARTETDKPLLSNDMHLGFNQPGIWYQMHHCVVPGEEKDSGLATERQLNVTGVVLPGQPYVVSGHNNLIAWGMTNVMIDDMDFFQERVDPSNPDRYLYKDQWLEMEVRTEKIKIKGGDTMERKLRFTVHGPVVSGFRDVKDEVITMHWAGNYPSNELRTVHLLNRARNFGDFKNALRTFKSLSQNIVYADTWGNIGIICASGIPIRKKGDGLDVVPGWTDEYEWRGFVPFEEQPFLYNPPSGMVLSANNRTAGPGFRYHISYWYYPSYRYDRIKEMIEAKEKLTVQDFMAMHGDMKSKLVSLMRDRIIATVSAADLDNDEKEVLDLFKKWDGTMAPESGPAAFFEYFYLSLLKNTFEDELGDELYKEYIHKRVTPAYAIEAFWKRGESAWFDDVTTEKKETMADIIVRSFKDAVEDADGGLGGDSEDWHWEEVHSLELKHPLGSVWILDLFFGLNRGPFQVGGSFHTVCPYSYYFDKPFAVKDGASQRHAYDLSDWDNSYSVIPTGNSGHPGSDHYGDQTELYMKNMHHPDYFSREKVEKSARYSMTFKKK